MHPNEGIEVLSLSFTPKLAVSSIVVRATCYVDGSTTNHIIGALFVDNTTNAFSVSDVSPDTAGRPRSFGVVGVYANSTSSQKVFKLRMGANTGTAYINRYSIADLFGAASLIVLEAEELAP